MKNMPMFGIGLLYKPTLNYREYTGYAIFIWFWTWVLSIGNHNHLAHKSTDKEKI